MTVLSIMILMVANIFQGSSASWNIGTQKADMNTSARAALDFMVRELACAVAGPIDKNEIGASYFTFRQEKIDDIRFLALANEPDASENTRAVRGVFFYLDSGEYTLRAGRKTDTSGALNCYSVDPSSPLSWSKSQTGSMMISNVLSLQFYVYTNESALAAGIRADFIDHYQLPFCLDIALEMLSDDDMRRFSILSGPPQDEFRARNAKIYTTRVYFPNRVGYGAR